MTWLACLGCACLGIVTAWLSLLVAGRAQRYLRPGIFAAALSAGGLLLTREAGSPLAFLVGCALGIGARLYFVGALRTAGGLSRSDPSQRS